MLIKTTVLLLVFAPACIVTQNGSSSGLSADSSQTNDSSFRILGSAPPVFDGSKVHSISFREEIKNNPKNFFVTIKTDTGETPYSGGANGLLSNGSSAFKIKLAYSKNFEITIQNKTSNKKTTSIFSGGALRSGAIKL